MASCSRTEQPAARTNTLTMARRGRNRSRGLSCARGTPPSSPPRHQGLLKSRFLPWISAAGSPGDGAKAAASCPKLQARGRGAARWRRRPREMPLRCLLRPNKQGEAAISNHPHHCAALRTGPMKLRSHLSHPQAARTSGLPVPIRAHPSPPCPALPSSQQLPVASGPPGSLPSP